jgi:hypothetical protein
MELVQKVINIIPAALAVGLLLLAYAASRK